MSDADTAPLAPREPDAGACAAVPGGVVGVATSHEELIAACRTRRHELGLPLLLQALRLELIVVRTVPHHERQRRVTAQGSCGRADAANRVKTAA